MIDDYISREAAVEKITFLCELREIVCNPDDEFLRGLRTALNTIKSNEIIPSADVRLVKHGRWECVGHDDMAYWYRCTVCGHEEHDNMTKHDSQCSCCGAIMDLKDDADNPSRCSYSGVRCYADDCGTCKERTSYFKEES